MLSMNDLKIGVVFVYENQPHQVLETRHLYLARGAAVLQTKLKNLITGRVISRNFKALDEFEEAEVDMRDIKYIYNHRGVFHFCDPQDSKQQFEIDESLLGEEKRFLKKEVIVKALFFEEKIRGIELPIKIDLEVMEAPPGIKGNSAQTMDKMITLETGTQIKAPLFIEAGDVVKVNTSTGEYVERVDKK